MANIALTNVCNLDCHYCFALSDTGHATGPREYVRDEQFEATLDFLERSKIPEARLLGGEPTLHPRFAQLAARAMERGFRVVVFSNAIIPDAALEFLEQASPESVALLINARAAQDHQPAQWRRIENTYRRLQTKICLGYNIASRVPELDFLLEHIARYGLGRTVRLGLAHPRLEGENEHLRPRDYPFIGRRIVEFARQCRQAQVQIDFDCGFVPCMFPEGTHELFGVQDFGLRCNPILDLMPDGKFISCFPLQTLHQEPLTPRAEASELRAKFTAEFAELRQATLYPECVDCNYRAAGRCSGGCLSSSLRRRRHKTFEVRADEIAAARPPAIPVAIPYIDQPVAFWEDLQSRYGDTLVEVYFPPPVDVLGTGRPEQPSRHLEEFLRHAPVRRSLLLNAITLQEPVEKIAPRVIDAIRGYRDRYGLHSATVADLSLAEKIHQAIPDLPLVASVLMDVFQPNQLLMLGQIFSTLVPSSRIVRDVAALKALRAAFPGKIRLLVNEACLSGCLYRVQHFHEMGSGVPYPKSLCDDLVMREPWMRLTGSWILPQHLVHYEGAIDEIKLAGRATLDDPARYQKVLRSYIRRLPLQPHEIGGGPASPLEPIEISAEFALRTSRCGQNCHSCSYCHDYYEATKRRVDPSSLVQIQLSPAVARPLP